MCLDEYVAIMSVIVLYVNVASLLMNGHRSIYKLAQVCTRLQAKRCKCNWFCRQQGLMYLIDILHHQMICNLVANVIDQFKKETWKLSGHYYGWIVWLYFGKSWENMKIESYHEHICLAMDVSTTVMFRIG